jgi:hypothetical protein
MAAALSLLIGTQEEYNDVHIREVHLLLGRPARQVLD